MTTNAPRPDPPRAGARTRADDLRIASQVTAAHSVPLRLSLSPCVLIRRHPSRLPGIDEDSVRWAGIRCVSTIPQVLRYIGNECAYVPVCESLFRLARVGW